jgi:hypothetical protein
MLELILAALLLGNPIAARDTVFDLRVGDRLVLEDFNGSVYVGVWGRDALEAESDSDVATEFEFHRSGSRVEMRVSDRKNRNRTDELRLRVPEWLNLEFSGRKLEAEIRGVAGTVKIRNLKGDLFLEDLSGEVDAVCVDGEIVARRLGGFAHLSTGSGEITVIDSSGELVLETVSGDMELSDLTPRGISARTTSGEIDFSGQLNASGRFSFQSHNGDLTLELRDPVALDVTVLAYEGEFESDFPVRTRGFRSGQEMAFTIGSGGGRLILEAFDGEIRLLRSGF